MDSNIGVAMTDEALCFLINPKSGGRLGTRVLDSVAELQKVHEQAQRNLSNVSLRTISGLEITRFSASPPKHEDWIALRDAIVPLNARLNIDEGKDDRASDDALKNLSSNRTISDSYARYESWLIVGGGDGTLKWAMELCERLVEMTLMSKMPRLVPFPLGTANELARVTGWLPRGMTLNKLNALLNVQNDHILQFDRWQVQVQPPPNNNKTMTIETRNVPMLCFASFGFDAKIVHQFEAKRTNAVWRNKAVYGWYGIKRLFSKHKSVGACLEVCVKQSHDEDEWMKIELPNQIQSLQIFNIATASDGIYFWGHQSSHQKELLNWHSPSPCDGRLELCGLYNVMHIVKTKFLISHSHRLSQCHSIRVKATGERMVMQIDGEAEYIAPGTQFTFVHDGIIPIVRGPGKCINL